MCCSTWASTVGKNVTGYTKVRVKDRDVDRLSGEHGCDELTEV